MDSQMPAPVPATPNATSSHGAQKVVLLFLVFAIVAGGIYFAINNGSKTFNGNIMNGPGGECPEGQILIGADMCGVDPAVQAAADAKAAAEAQAQAEADARNAELLSVENLTAQAAARCALENMDLDRVNLICIPYEAPQLSDEEQAQALVDAENAAAMATAQALVDAQVSCEADGNDWDGQKCSVDAPNGVAPVAVAAPQPVVDTPLVNASGGMVPNREMLDAPLDQHFAAVQKNVGDSIPALAPRVDVQQVSVPAASPIAAVKNIAKAKTKTASASSKTQHKSSISIPVEAFANPDSLTAAAVQDKGTSSIRGGVNGREIRGDTGPEMLLYPVLVGLANGAYLLKKRLKK